MASEYVTHSKCEDNREMCLANRKAGGRWAFGIIWAAVFVICSAAIGFALDSTRNQTQTQADIRSLEKRAERVETAIDTLPRIERALDRIESQVSNMEHP